MSWDEVEARLEEDNVEAVWVPSPRLSRELWNATIATLVTGGLYAASAAFAIADGPQPGFAMSEAFAWAALLPAIWIVVTYTSLGEEVGSPAIGRSVQCLFLSTVLLRLFELASHRLFIPPVQAVLWIFLVCGVGSTIVWTFISGFDTPPSKPTQDEKKVTHDATTAGAARVGIGGAIAIGIFAVFKFFGKAILKVAIFKGIINFFQQLHLPWLMIAALLPCVYLVWFAIVKIRARARLGGLASLVGWIEIMRVMLLIGLSVLFVTQLIECGQQPGLNQAEIDRERVLLHRELFRQYAAIELGLDLVWTALTVCLFLSLRSRRDLEAEHNADFARAMADTR